MANYLVIGSEGQVGLGLCEFLKKKGHEVLHFDIVNRAEEDARTYNNGLLDELMKKADYVFFLAFDVGGARYLSKYQKTYDFVNNNTEIVRNVFNSIKKHNKKFIFTSSQMSSMSFSNYGVLKRLGEIYTEILGGLTVKFWNVYGLEKDLEKSHVITDLILKAKNEKQITLMTNGKESRQFLHVDDCSECLYILSQKDAEIPRGQELHITSFEWNSILDVANIISENFSKIPVKPNEAAIDTVQKDSKNEPDRYILKHWQPKIKLREGIKSIIEKM